MKSRIIASVLAASMALTAVTVAPARADNAEIGRTILGVAALAILLGALSNDNNNNVIVTRPHDYGHDYGHDNGGGYGHGYDMSLPISCQYAINTKYGAQNVLGRGCLSEHYRYYASLPSRCEFTVNTSRGTRTVFGSYCLRQQGYRIEARR